VSRFLPLLLALVLSGCYSDQKQEVATCQLQAKQHTDPNEDVQIQDVKSSEYIELCMQAHGYEIVEDNCPVRIRTDSVSKPDPHFYASLSESEKYKLNLETGKKLMAIEGIQKIEPACYEPLGWVGKRSLRLEKWLGISN
jgi:hypothetical protein